MLRTFNGKHTVYMLTDSSIGNAFKTSIPSIKEIKLQTYHRESFVHTKFKISGEDLGTLLYLSFVLWRIVYHCYNDAFQKVNQIQHFISEFFFISCPVINFIFLPNGSLQSIIHDDHYI